MLEDLSAFTGISKDKIVDYFDSSRIDNTKYELFDIVCPRSREELVWYYRNSRAEFVSNATKYWDTGRGWPLLDKWVKKGDCVLDYGAGTGQNAFYLQSLGAWPVYFEISILQMEFFRFRCKRRGIGIPILEPHVLTMEGDYRFDPIRAVCGVFNVILLSQVLEHIVNPGELLSHLVGLLSYGGLLLEDTPWSSHNLPGLESWTSSQFESFMEGLGMEKLSHGVWKRCPRKS